MRFLERLNAPEPVVCVELRPPRRDLNAVDSIDAWLALNAAARRLAAEDTLLFLTDSAVGTREEENLQHLLTNVDDGFPLPRFCPFLTTKHSLEYCLWYAARAKEAGCTALTVLGGDRDAGPARCVPHGYLLRQRIRERFPELALGGWANPYRDPSRQAQYLLDPRFTAEFYLAQVVSHYDLAPVERFLAALQGAGVERPGVFGVFYWRSGRKRTLEMLSRFLPVPVDGLARDFASGKSADEICAETIRALRGLGIDKVYISNLDANVAAARLQSITELLNG